MDEKIRSYADALYEQSMHESGRIAREEQVAFQREIAARQSTGNLPLGGTEIQGMLRLKVAYIDRCILSRLDSYQKAFSEVGATPTDQDLTGILNDLQAVQQLQIRHSAQALNNFLKTRGRDGDLTTSLTEASGHGYDRALQQWKSWRAQSKLRNGGGVERKFSDPYPKDLRGVQEDMDYWAARQHEASSGSEFDQKLRARLEQLRHLHDRYSLQTKEESMKEVRPPMTAVDEASGKARRVWVVHGRDVRLRSAMFTFLGSIGLHPLEFSEARQLTGKASPYVGEILEAAFRHAQAVLVLLTPDDEARLRPDLVNASDGLYEKELTGQARPNVLFEAGMALVSHPNQTVLVQIGTLRPFSDVAGRHLVQMDGSTQKRQDIADRLRTAGCPVNLSGTEWHTAGDFAPSARTQPLADAVVGEATPEKRPKLRFQAIATPLISYDYSEGAFKHQMGSQSGILSKVLQISNSAIRGIGGKAVHVRAQAKYHDKINTYLVSPLPWVDSKTSDVIIGIGEVKELIVALRGPHNLWDFASHGQHGVVTPPDSTDFDLEIDLIDVDGGSIIKVEPPLAFHWHWRESPLSPELEIVYPDETEA